MPDKKLTKRQQARIEARQKQRVSESHDGYTGQQGQIVNLKSRSALVKSDSDIFEAGLRRTLPPLACGDIVVLEEAANNEKVVTALIPRRSELIRHLQGGRSKLVAANIDLILIILAVVPEPDLELLDNYLVAAETSNIEPLIILNKLDLKEHGNFDAARTHLDDYEKIGYQVIYTSAKTREGLDQLQTCLKGRTSIFSGQSGVGKSSLTRLLVPDQDIQVGRISDSTEHGRHTTSASMLYDLPGGGQIMDTPGVRDFSSQHLAPETLVGGFREIAAIAPDCKFNNCSHTVEPGCEVIAAVNDKRISKSRYDHYVKLLQSATDS